MDHIPVMKEEVIAALEPKSDGVYLDCTVGDGGHTEALLQASEPNGRVIALDGDSNQVAFAQKRLAGFANRVTVIRSQFSELDAVARENGVAAFDGILFDLGYSSRQLSDANYGLAYDDELNLDMRLHGQTMSAADWLNHANEVEIGDVFYQYGDRHNSRQLARKIMAFRKFHGPLTKVRDLKEALGLFRPGDLAPIWQAIRIVVNDEFDQIRQGITKAVQLLKPDGRLVVITFHSGEDRLVKHLLQRLEEVKLMGKPISPSYNEIKRNRRARSAKLRVAVRLS